MLGDIGTVIWKELKEMLFRRGNLRGGIMGIAVLIVVFGVFLPLNSGRAWVSSPTTLAYWAWIPLLLVSSVVADSFAGERERHTLETLLASRLPDRAILLGKVAAAVGYAWGATMVTVLLGLVTINLANLGGPLLLYSTTLFLAIILISFLGACLAAAAGVLVSLRASTVRQAQQTLSVAVLVLVFALAFGVQALPGPTKAELDALLMRTGAGALLAVACLVLLLLDVALLLLASVRFRRARLILD